MDIALSNYPLKVLHDYALDIKQALRTAHWVLEYEGRELGNIVDSSIDRLLLLPMAARVLIQLIGKLQPTNIYFSRLVSQGGPSAFGTIRRRNFP